MHREYPNKIAHVLQSDDDVLTPRVLTPAFYGCYDWHSSVHGHWLLARLAHRFPGERFAKQARAALAASLTPANIAAEVAYLRGPGRTSFERPYGLAWLLEERARRYYRADRDCPLRYEPSGEDFLSPCLAEADFMGRVLPPNEFAAWLDGFLPGLPTDGRVDWLVPGIVTDRTDPKLAQIDGLNMSRAWMLEGIASRLPEPDRRRAALLAAARAHAAAALPAVTGEHYEGGHWLGTFAVYLTTQAGLRQ